MRFYPLLFLLTLSGCIGQPLLNNSADNRPRAEIYAQAEKDYDDMFLTKPSAVLIKQYGNPSRTGELADGTKTLEYKSRIRYVYQDGTRDQESCVLRFWTVQNHISRIDSIGDKNVCMHFVVTKKRDDYMDYRKNKGWQLEPK